MSDGTNNRIFAALSVASETGGAKSGQVQVTDDTVTAGYGDIATLSLEFAEAQRFTQELSEHLERDGGLHNVRIQLSQVRPAVRGRAVGSGFLIAIVQAHMERHGVSEAEVARRIGLSPSAVHGWRHEGFVRLPRQGCLSALAQVTGLTYGEVLTAALLDIGYVDDEEQSAVFRLILDDPPR